MLSLLPLHKGSDSPKVTQLMESSAAAQTLLSDLKPSAAVLRSLLLLGPPSQASVHHTSIFWKRVILELSQKTRGTHSQNFTYPFSWSSSLVVFQPWWGNKPIPNKPKIVKTAEQKWVLHEGMHVSWDKGWSLFFFFLNTSQVWLHDFLGIIIIMVQVTNTVHIWICIIFFTTWILETKLMKANQSWPDKDANYLALREPFQRLWNNRIVLMISISILEKADFHQIPFGEWARRTWACKFWTACEHWDFKIWILICRTHAFINDLQWCLIFSCLFFIIYYNFVQID